MRKYFDDGDDSVWWDLRRGSRAAEFLWVFGVVCVCDGILGGVV